MKQFIYEAKQGQTVEINIGYDYFRKVFDIKKYNNFYLYDKKISFFNKIKLNNEIPLIGNENLKSFDKYLTLVLRLSNFDINYVNIFGGYSVLELSGYTLENINISNYSFYPSTLNSAIMLPLKGKYYLNFNWKKDFLVQKGYPKKVNIDTKLFETIPQKEMKNMFIIPYLLGKILDSKISDLSLNYSKLIFSEIDLQEYIYFSVKQWIYYLKSKYRKFPGENIITLFYNKKSGFNKSFPQVFAMSFLIELYISWYYGFLDFEMFEKIEKELKENFDIPYKLIESIDFNDFYCKKEFSLFTSSGKIISYKIPYDEIKNIVKEVKEYFRGGFL